MKLDRKGMGQRCAGLSKPCCHSEPYSKARPSDGFTQKRRVMVAYLRRSLLFLQRWAAGGQVDSRILMPCPGDRKQARMGQFRGWLPNQLGGVTDGCLTRCKEWGSRKTMDETGFWLDHLGDRGVTERQGALGEGQHSTWGFVRCPHIQIRSLNRQLQGGTEPGKQIWVLSASDSGSQPRPPTGILWWILNVFLPLGPISNK